MRKLIHVVVVLTLVMGLAVSLSAEPKATVGFAVGDYPFHIEKSEIRGNGTIFAGETVTSHYLPTQLNLNSGSSLLLGIGSVAQIFDAKVVLKGGTVEIQSAGDALIAVEAAGLTFQPMTADTKAVVYSDRADMVSVSVEIGSVAVHNAKGEQIRVVDADSRAAFAHTQQNVKIERDERATLEIARIQARQIEHMGKLSKNVPAFKEKSTEMMGMLAAASGGYISATSGSAGIVPSSGSEISPITPPSFDFAALKDATTTVNQLHPTIPDQMGCGEPGCNPFHPLNTNNILVGHPTLGGGLPTLPGFCVICFPNLPFPHGGQQQ